MAVDIEQAITLLQAVNRAVPGVRRAPALDKYPGQIAAADLPYVLTWPGAGSWFQKGHGRAQDDRTFRILAYVQPLGQNDPPTRLLEATRLLQAMRARYVTPSTISLGEPDANGGYQYTIESRDGNPQSDDGITVDLTWGGTTYLGFELRVRVRTLWDATG